MHARTFNVVPESEIGHIRVSQMSQKNLGQKFLMSNYFITHIIEIKYSYNCNDNPTMVLDG